LPPNGLAEGHVKTTANVARSVLIVEDDTLVRTALDHLLGRLGYHTVAVGSVAEGLAVLDGQACAILDLNLPDGLGTVILERIREEERPIRVAIATGTSDLNLLSEAERHRPDLVLRKPVDLNALLEWLRNVAG
jgi:two-component system response regulator PilR (NtrC family)